MFHRVKSEPEKTQAAYPEVQKKPRNETNQPANALTAGNTAAQPAQAAAPTVNTVPAPVATPAPVKPASPINTLTTANSTNTTNTVSEKKETATMNDTTDNKFGSDDSSKAVDIPSSVYSTQTSRPAYPGAAYTTYGVQNSASTSSNTNLSAASEERRLVIGRGITVSGEIESCDTLIVEGTIEAALKGAKILEISESGTFYGTVEINEATVAGRFEGDLTVNGRLTVSSGGVITGTIAYKELEIQAGAVIDGKITPLRAGALDAKGNAGKERSKSPKEAAALAKAREIKAQPDQQFTSGNDEGELFSARAAAAE